MIARRGLLTGLVVTLAAPAVVRAENLMPVKVYDPFYYRYLLDYLPGSDETVLRMDCSTIPFHEPSQVLRTLQEHELKDFAGAERALKALRLGAAASYDDGTMVKHMYTSVLVRKGHVL